MTNRIFIVDDDSDILELLEYNFSREGYNVDCCDSPNNAFHQAISFKPTLIILDVVMAGLNGFELCEQFRNSTTFQQTPVFMLTALVEPFYEQQAYRSGADDFIHKMLGTRSISKRVELVLEQKLIIKKRINHFQVGPWIVSRSTHQVGRDNRVIKLNPDEFEVFYFIAQNSHRFLTRDHIDQVINSSNIFKVPVSIDAYLDNLFKKLESQWLVERGKRTLRLNTH